MKLSNELKQFGLPALDLEKILDRSLRNGGDFSELFFEDTVSTRMVYESGCVDSIVQGIDRGVGLRIVFQGKSVYGYTTDLTEEALLALAEGISAGVNSKSGMKKNLRSVEWVKASQTSAEIEKYQVSESPQSTPMATKIELLKRAESAARKRAIGVRQATVALLDSLRKIWVVNSDGLMMQDQKTYLQMAVQIVGQQGERVESASVSKGGYVGMEFFDETSPESLAEEAADRVNTLLKAKPAPAGTMPVVIASEAGGTMIHEAVGHGLEADLACNGLSVYQGKLGQKVASPLISVVDDGTLPAKRGSYRFDDEGTPSRKNTLIENGVLKSYLVDRLSSMKFDLMATGNGRRESFRCKPIVRMTNTYIEPGKDNPEDILKETPWGIYVKAMGGGQVNTVTGDFVFAVTEAYLIRDGQLGDPIRGATLVGNGPRVLSQVDRVGHDLGFSTGTCGKDGQGAPVTDAQPTLRIPELTVGGEVPLKTYWDSTRTGNPV